MAAYLTPAAGYSGGNHDPSNANPVSYTATNGAPTGSLVTVGVMLNSNGSAITAAITDNAAGSPNNYGSAVQSIIPGGTGGKNGALIVFRCFNVIGNPTVYTVTCTGANAGTITFLSLSVDVWTGIITSSDPLDGSVINQQNAVSIGTDNILSGSFAAAYPNDLIVCYSKYTPTSAHPTVGTGFTLGQQYQNSTAENGYASSEYILAGSAGTNQGTWDATATVDCITAAMAFRQPLPASFMFGQDDWPLPKAPSQFNRGYSTSYFFQRVIGQDSLDTNSGPIVVGDWPLPRVSPFLNRTHFLPYPRQLVPGRDSLPFNQDDWPLPNRAKPNRDRSLDTLTVSYNPNLIGGDLLPNNQDSWPLPSRGGKAGRTPDLDTLSIAYNPNLIGGDTLPRNQLDWPLPNRGAKPGRSRDLDTITESYNLNLVGADALPKNQLDWPLPSRGVRFGRSGNLDTQTASYLLGLIGQDFLPNVQRDWPTPKTPFQPNRSSTLYYSLGLLSGADALPFSQRDWPLFNRGARSGRSADLDTWGTNYNLALLFLPAFPFVQTDWPLSRTAFQFSRSFGSWYPLSLIGQDVLPNRQQNWPLFRPLRSGRSVDLDTLGTYYNLPLLLLPVFPFAQRDWPNPKTAFQFARSFSLWYPQVLIGRDVFPSGRQRDWLVPRSPRSGRSIDLDTWGTQYNLSLLSILPLHPFNQLNWPLPITAFRSADLRTWGTLSNINFLPIIIPRPFAQLDWPLPISPFQFNRAFRLPPFIIPQPPQLQILNLMARRWISVADLSSAHNYTYPYYTLPAAWHGSPYRWQPTPTPMTGERNFTIYFCSEFITEDTAPLGLTFVKPSGRLLPVTGVTSGVHPIVGSPIPSNKYVAYTFLPTDLDEAGEWEVRLTAGSGPGRFFVLQSRSYR